MFISTNAQTARDRAQLIASDVSVTRGPTLVLNQVDLVVTPTSRIAVLGENGRGKSTLLHVLDGTLPPDSGTVQRIGTLGVAEQEMPANNGRTVGQAVADAIAEPLRALAELDAAMLALSSGSAVGAQRYEIALQRAEALDAWDAERRVQIALAALDAETDPERLLDTLSVGQVPGTAGVSAGRRRRLSASRRAYESPGPERSRLLERTAAEAQRRRRRGHPRPRIARRGGGHYRRSRSVT